ncbi:protein kinase domain-containing protein [Scytonema sp. PCC 10023]|uniref:protein kinase domain-containing protein n=1 Tax=Scytonema sp. PCC 10023 TaxID=1680591 RepID=UPI0039C70163
MLPGQILRQRYKIIRLLGSGAFGVTYLAEDLDLPDHSLCVVKNLKQMQYPEALQAATELFNREAKVLQRLGNECPQIPRLFAYFQENGEFYLVQEFIDGHDLSEEIFPGNRLSEAQVTQLLQEILEVLIFIHDQNIIHRDIKPENLMRRNTDGKIILIDFGVVKQISGLGVNSQGQTNISFIVGTYGYIPSEQSGGNPRLSSDVYALGMLGIYALTGVKPKDLPKDHETLEVIWRDRASVSPRLADVLDKMVRYDFKKRYQTAAEALQALRPSSLPPSLPSPLPSLPTPTRRELKLYQKVLISTGVGVSVLIGVGLLFMSFWRPFPDDLGQFIAGVRLVCPHRDVPPLQNIPGTRIERGAAYEFSNVKPLTGRGTIIYDTGNKYYGDVKNGFLEGCGTYEYGPQEKNFHSYIGQFNINSQQGVGKLIFKNGCKYIGEFKKNNYDDKGIFIPKHGLPVWGTWHQGKLEGSNNTFYICN